MQLASVTADSVHRTTKVEVSGFDHAKFQEIAEQDAKDFPATKVVSRTEISLEAKLA